MAFYPWLAKALNVTRLGRSDLFDVTLTLSDGKDFPIADLGYGLSQVLPVLTQCSFAPAGSTLLFEQPEIHLHTLAAKPLASVFQDTASRGIQVVLETHSPDLIHGFQGLIANHELAPTDLMVYRVARNSGCTALTEVPIEPDAEIYENWTSGLSVP